MGNQSPSIKMRRSGIKKSIFFIGSLEGFNSKEKGFNSKEKGFMNGAPITPVAPVANTLSTAFLSNNRSVLPPKASGVGNNKGKWTRTLKIKKKKDFFYWIYP
jgi:hypothetical protein